MPANSLPQSPEQVRPQRIQLRRTKGFSLARATAELNGLPAVKCTRPGILGNPFKGPNAVEAYRKYLTVGGGYECGPEHGLFLAYIPTRHHANDVRELLPHLRGKNLGCFCPLDKPCHCDVLLELANK